MIGWDETEHDRRIAVMVQNCRDGYWLVNATTVGTEPFGSDLKP